MHDQPQREIIVRQFTKKIKRTFREYAIEAYESELQRELNKLDQGFNEWRNGEISSGELSHRLHQFEIGVSKDLYKRYNYGEYDINVAYALVTGILDESEVPGELMEALKNQLSFFRSLKERGELQEPAKSAN